MGAQQPPWAREGARAEAKASDGFWYAAIIDGERGNGVKRAVCISYPLFPSYPSSWPRTRYAGQEHGQSARAGGHDGG